MATPVEITYRVVGADQVAGALQQMENRARQMSSAMTSTMAPARQGIAALSSSLSHAASVMQLAGGATADLAQRLQTATIAIFATTTAIQALRGATLAWAGSIAIANAAMVSLASIAATITAAVLAAPFAAAAIVAGGLVTTLVLLKPELFGFKTAIAEISAEMDIAVIRAASWVKAWANLDTAFQLVRESAFGLRLELRGLLGVTDELAQRWRVGITKITTEQAKESQRLAETARREAEAHKKLADAIQEARMQRELDLIVQINVAERARDIVDALRRQTQTLRDWADAVAQQLNPAMQAAIDLFLSFKTPAEEGVIQPANQITENLEAIADAARQAARVLGIEWAGALTVARQALQLAKEEGIGLADALARIKFNRDFLIELELVDSDMKKWFDMWEKIKFGLEDINIQVDADPALAALDQLAARAKEMKQAIGEAFVGLFSDILSGARTFGESVANILRELANMLLRFLVFKVFLPFLGLQRGGIVAGGLTPIFAAQGGGIVSRPTLALMGEGRQSEAVVPLPDNRSIPVTFTGGRQERMRPQEIIVRVINVFDRSQIPQVTAGQITATIVNDINSRGPIEKAMRVALR